jgi:hypothetical protein
MKRQYNRINKEWHQNNRMPKNPSMDERIRWHREHADHCKCRPVPEKLKNEIKQRGQRNESGAVS